MARPATLALAALLCVAAQAVQYAFKADFVYRHESLMGMGYAKGTMYYRYDTTTPKNAVVVYKYTEPTEISIYKVPADERIYKRCTACEGADKPGLILPPLRAQDLTCNEQGGKVVCTDGGGSTLKQAVFASSDAAYPQEYNLTDGKYYSLSNQDTSLSYNDDVFTVKEEWDCGHCVAMLDLFLLMDGSVSIGPYDWVDAVEFAANLVNMFTLSDSATAISIIAWDIKAKVVWPLSTTRRMEINTQTMSWEKYGKGPWTHQYTGFREMINQLNENSTEVLDRGTSRGLNSAIKPTRVAVVVTDGKDFSEKAGKEWANLFKDTYQGTVIEVGVGSDTDEKFMREMASLDANKEPLVLQVGSYSELKRITDSIVTMSCSYNKNEDTCNQGCKGFCACSAECYCPTCDVLENKCRKNTCDGDLNTVTGCQEADIDCLYNTNNCVEVDCPDNTTGICVTTDVDCTKTIQDKNETECYCAISSCDPSKGCSVEEEDSRCPKLPCMDLVKCDCNEYGHQDYPGCVYVKRTCDTGIACLAGYCDESSDTCKSYSNCSSDKLCEPKRCNEETGQCEPDPVVNYCEKRSCKNLTCEESTGRCIYPDVDCKVRENDPDPCKEWTCNAENDTCTSVTIEGCTSCGENQCMHKPCHTVRCKKDVPQGEDPCEYIEVSCVRDDCETGWCNNETDQCEYKSICEKGNECFEPVCLSKGVCKLLHPQGICEGEDPCHECECDNSTGVNSLKNPCPDKPCKEAVCIVTEGGKNHTCEYVNRTCTMLEAYKNCYTVACDPEKDDCVFQAISCDDGNPCTIDSCDLVRGCVHEPIPEDQYPTRTCMIATCDPTRPEDDKWVFTEKCKDVSYCNRSRCNYDTDTCEEYKRDCSKEMNLTEYPCFYADCVYSKDICYARLLDGVVIDICGNCYVLGENESSDTTARDQECMEDFVMPPTQAALTGGVIAAIVIGCAVAVAGLTAGGVFGTKALIKRAKDAAGQGAQMNPLYEADSREASNPMYEATK